MGGGTTVNLVPTAPRVGDLVIVADSNLIAAYWIRSEQTANARRVRRRDADWVVPPLWSSEFQSVLRQYLVRGDLTLAQVLWFADKAEADLARSERRIDSAAVLKLAQLTRHSAYDCEYVALAEAEGVRLVTGDKAVARLFPTVAVLLEDFAAGA